MRGQFQHELNQPYTNKKLSNAWLSDSRLKGATESIIFAIQEQAITTRYIDKHTFNIQSRTKFVWTTAKNGVVTDTTSNVQPI